MRNIDVKIQVKLGLRQIGCRFNISAIEFNEQLRCYCESTHSKIYLTHATYKSIFDPRKK